MINFFKLNKETNYIAKYYTHNHEAFCVSISISKHLHQKQKVETKLVANKKFFFSIKNAFPELFNNCFFYCFGARLFRICVS